MKIQDWAKDQINNLIANYERKNCTEGGLFTKAQAMLELERRAGGSFDGKEVTRTTLEKRETATDGCVRYGDIWCHYFPEKQWVGNRSENIVGQALHATAYYCATNNLPIVTALVSQAAGHITEQAKQNMFDCASDWGVAQGIDVDEFYDINIAELQELGADNLP